MTVIDLVFAPGVRPPQAADLVQHALDGMATAEAFGRFEKQVEQQIGEKMFTQRWRRGGTFSLAVDLTFDSSIPVLMLSVVSMDEPSVQSVSTQLMERLGASLESPEQTLDAAIAAPRDAALLVRAAVVFAQRFNGKLFTLIDDALRSQSSDLKQAGAKAAALVKYAQLVPGLRQALEHEREEDTARMLALALAKVRNAHEG